MDIFTEGSDTLHFANLTNGVACAPDDPMTRFSRIQSTWCEQKRWDDILLTLPMDMYVALAVGVPVIVHDQSERARTTRAQWQGLSWIRYACRAAWGLPEEPEYSRSGMNVTAQWRAIWESMPKRVTEFVDYYKTLAEGQVVLDPCQCPRICWREDMKTPSMAQLAESDRIARECDRVFSFKRAIPKWMTTFDRPWEYMSPMPALSSSEGGKR